MPGCAMGECARSVARRPDESCRVRRLIGFYLTGEFGRFLLAGGTAAAANFASRFAFQTVLGFHASVVAAYGVGFMTAFFLNRRFVFPASGKPMRQEMAWFFLFNALAFPTSLSSSFQKSLP